MYGAGVNWMRGFCRIAYMPMYMYIARVTIQAFLPPICTEPCCVQVRLGYPYIAVTAAS